MFDDLISYDELHEASTECFGFGGVLFLRDFGPWKRGQQVESLWFDLETGMVKSQDENGETLESCNFQLVEKK